MTNKNFHAFILEYYINLKSDLVYMVENLPTKQLQIFESFEIQIIVLKMQIRKNI
jgi:hypothetical protein